MAMFLTLPYMEMFEKLPKTEHSLKTLPFLAFSRDIAVFGSRLYCLRGMLSNESLGKECNSLHF